MARVINAIYDAPGAALANLEPGWYRFTDPHLSTFTVWVDRPTVYFDLATHIGVLLDCSVQDLKFKIIDFSEVRKGKTVVELYRSLEGAGDYRIRVKPIHVAGVGIKYKITPAVPHQGPNRLVWDDGTTTDIPISYKGEESLDPFTSVSPFDTEQEAVAYLEERGWSAASSSKSKRKPREIEWPEPKFSEGDEVRLTSGVRTSWVVTGLVKGIDIKTGKPIWNYSGENVTETPRIDMFASEVQMELVSKAGSEPEAEPEESEGSEAESDGADDAEKILDDSLENIPDSEKQILDSLMREDEGSEDEPSLDDILSVAEEIGNDLNTTLKSINENLSTGISILRRIFPTKKD